MLSYLNDIFIKGKNTENHYATLKQVLTLLRNTGIHRKCEKSKFVLPEIELLRFQGFQKVCSAQF